VGGRIAAPAAIAHYDIRPVEGARPALEEDVILRPRRDIGLGRSQVSGRRPAMAVSPPPAKLPCACGRSTGFVPTADLQDRANDRPHRVVSRHSPDVQ